MLDRINDLLGWDTETQELMRKLSEPDMAKLLGAAQVFEGELNEEDDELDPENIELYAEFHEVLNVTTKGTAFAELCARLVRKGWMVENFENMVMSDMPADVRAQSLEYYWTPKGARLLPQLLSHYNARQPR